MASGVKRSPACSRAMASSCAAGMVGEARPAAVISGVAAIAVGTCSISLPLKVSMLNTITMTSDRHRNAPVTANTMWNGRLNRPTTLCASIQNRFRLRPGRTANRSFLRRGRCSSTPDTSASPYSTEMMPMKYVPFRPRPSE
ncbi:hypothetical protein D3C81_1682160 [compost metagenome]